MFQLRHDWNWLQLDEALEEPVYKAVLTKYTKLTQ